MSAQRMKEEEKSLDKSEVIVFSENQDNLVLLSSRTFCDNENVTYMYCSVAYVATKYWKCAQLSEEQDFLF